MDQRQRGRSGSRIGSISLSLASTVLLLAGAVCLNGCGDTSNEGMIANPKDVTKTTDAQDSMKDYMKQMQKHGMKPGMKSAVPAK